MKTPRISLAALLLASLTDAFVAPAPRTPPTVLSQSSDADAEYSSWFGLPPIKDINFGEESRKYRRTVYSHDDWVKHRSPDRFIYYLTAVFQSGVYRNVYREIAVVFHVAGFVWTWNLLTGGYTDFAGVKHGAILAADWLPKLGLPLVPFTLASPSLGLLLGKIYIYIM